MTLSVAQRRQRQEAAIKHNLFAQAAPNLRGQAYRYGRLAERLLNAAPDLTAFDAATVRSWARLECAAADRFAAWQRDQSNEKLYEQWLSAERQKLLYSRELFLTPAARLAAAHLARDLRNDADAERAHAELLAAYARPGAGNGGHPTQQSSDAADGQDGRHSDAEAVDG